MCTGAVRAVREYSHDLQVEGDLEGEGGGEDDDKREKEEEEEKGGERLRQGEDGEGEVCGVTSVLNLTHHQVTPDVIQTHHLSFSLTPPHFPFCYPLSIPPPSITLCLSFSLPLSPLLLPPVTLFLSPLPFYYPLSLGLSLTRRCGH